MSRSRRAPCFILAFLCSLCCFAQSKIYNIDFKKDGLLLGGGLALWSGSKWMKASAAKPTTLDISQLDGYNVWGLDRGAISNSSVQADQMSDVLLYGSISAPFVTYMSKHCRGEGGAIALMALETFFMVDGITNVIKSSVGRYRPFNYNSAIPEDVKLSNGSKYSFVSGHTSNAAAFSFFTASVMSDLFPSSKLKPLFWASAITIPAVTGYLRYEAGKHFPTDIVAGYALGAAVGTLIPKLHKKGGGNWTVGVGNGLMVQVDF